MPIEATAPTPLRVEQTTTRLYYLDALRVVAILFVFLFHAVHPFDLNPWHVKNIEQSLTLTVILVILWMWGMPFFFMVAGAGSWLALRRRTARQFAVERTKRLLVPLIFFSLISFFFAKYFEWGNMVYRGITSDTFPQYLQTVWDGVSQRGITPLWLSTGQHLWFLGFLYAFAILTLPLFIWFKGARGRQVIHWLANICRLRAGLLVFLLPLLLVRYLITPRYPLEHDWADFIFMAVFFILGFLLFSDEAILQSVRRDGWLYGAIGLSAVLFTLVLFLLGNPAIEWVSWYGTPQFLIAWSIITLVALSWSLCMLSIGMKYMNVDKAWIHYAQEIALPFFILHQPVILVIASFVVKWDLGIPLKMLVVVGSSFIVCWALCEFVIKRVGFLRFLFGMTSSTPLRKQAPQLDPAIAD
jgi:glucans biosynthesis protein C